MNSFTNRPRRSELARHLVTGMIATALILLCGIFSAADIFVAPSGNDNNAGSTESPVATLQAAQLKARSVAGKEAVTVHVADGVYYLPETLVFTPKDSGSAEHPIVYKADNEGQAILSGGSELQLELAAASRRHLQGSNAGRIEH